MSRDRDHTALRYRLETGCHDAQGRRLHALIWVVGALVLAAFVALAVIAVSYLNSEHVNPASVPVVVMGSGLSIALIVNGIWRMVSVVPSILEARNASPAMPLARKR